MKKLKEFTNQVAETIFSADQGFQDHLKDLLSEKDCEQLHTTLKKWEAKIPGWEKLATEASRPEKLPRVQKYDEVGNRVEDIILPIETKTIKREVVETGIFEGNTEVEKFAKIYLLAQIGESGVTCPLACTDGLIRSIEALGSDFLKEKYLPLLSSVEEPIAGAQFITEQTGGSDVGAIEGTAKQNGDHWLLTAEKWYCSATDEFFLVGARPEGAPEGTAGIAIFFVPRSLKFEGKDVPNNISIRRLKDKLGTQSLPTAEIDFEGSKAYLIGNAEDGIHHLMNYVLNASRIHNATNALGLIHRAFLEARNYAEQRAAFQTEIINFPLIQEYLLNILTYVTAKRNLTFTMLNEIDTHGFLPEDKEQRLWQRFLINLMKYRTAVFATEKVKEAILVFGANGIIQDFSIVPRLLRDALIVETWEGTHNVLCLQILRDSARFDFVGRLKKELKTMTDNWPDDVLTTSKKLYLANLARAQELLIPENLSNMTWVQTHACRVVDLVADLLEIGNLVGQGIRQKNNNTLLQAAHMAHTTFGQSGFDNPVLNGLKDFGLQLVREEPVTFNVREF